MRMTPDNFAVLSHETLLQMKRHMEDQGGCFPPSRARAGNPVDSFMGIPMRSSPIFPYQADCQRCEGTGHGGRTSTYCQLCNGAGESRFVGAVMEGAKTMLITTKLPRKFDPEFPSGLVAQPRPCRIVI